MERLVRQEASFREFGRLLALRVAQDLQLVATNASRLPWLMLDGGQNRIIQSALLLQHAARLSLMATVVEIVHLLPDAEVEALAVGVDPRLRPHWRERVQALRMHPASGRWPLLWQVYLSCWGGFLVSEHRQEEMELIAAEVGMRVDEVDAGLGVFDTFFPQQDGRHWHVRTSSGLDVLALAPAALRGLGVYHRLQRHGVYELNRDRRAMVVEHLQSKLNVNQQAAQSMASWHDIGARTLVGQVT